MGRHGVARIGKEEPEYPSAQDVDAMEAVETLKQAASKGARKVTVVTVPSLAPSEKKKPDELPRAPEQAVVKRARPFNPEEAAERKKARKEKQPAKPKTAPGLDQQIFDDVAAGMENAQILLDLEDATADDNFFDDKDLVEHLESYGLESLGDVLQHHVWDCPDEDFDADTIRYSVRCGIAAGLRRLATKFDTTLAQVKK
jgi:hypothetical protein